MANIDLRKLIIPTKLTSSYYETSDLIYADSIDEVRHNFEVDQDRRVSATDWAVLNDAYVWRGLTTSTGKRGVTKYWLRSEDVFSDRAQSIDESGEIVDYLVNDSNVTICPTMRLDVRGVVNAINASDELFKVATVKDKSGNEFYHTIRFGEYPKTFVGDRVNVKLECAYFDGQLTPTGKKYIGKIEFDYAKYKNNIVYHDEYEYCGERYVRVKSATNSTNHILSDGTNFTDGKNYWVKVEPITWKIRNWQQMPTEINPRGNGRATYIDVRTDEAIAVLPFYTKQTDNGSNLWVNSTLRGYLNGINLSRDKNCNAFNGGDFSNHNFLSEAMTVVAKHSTPYQDEIVK